MMLLPETIDRDEVDDLDDPPTQVCYFIVGGNDDGLFVLDIYRHELSVSISDSNSTILCLSQLKNEDMYLYIH